MTRALDSERSAIDIGVDPGCVVDRFPGLACIVDSERILLISNAHWHNLGFVGPGDSFSLPAEISAGLLALSHTAHPQRLPITIPEPRNGEAFVIRCHASAMHCRWR